MEDSQVVISAPFLWENGPFVCMEMGGQEGEGKQAGLCVLTIASIIVQIYTVKLFHRIFFLRKNAKMV